MKYYYLLLEIIPLACWIYSYRVLKRGSQGSRVQSSNKFSVNKVSEEQLKIGKSLKMSSTLLILLNVIFFFMNVTNMLFVTLLNVLIPCVAVLSSKKQRKVQNKMVNSPRK